MTRSERTSRPPKRRSLSPPATTPKGRDPDAGKQRIALGDSIGYCCPKCGGELVRVHRRFIDRLLLSPVYRFRCNTMVCGYECLLRDP